MMVLHNKLYKVVVGQDCMRGELSGTAAQDHWPEKKEGNGASKGKGPAAGVTCLHDVAQQLGGESLGQKAPKGHSGLVLLQTWRLSYLWPANTGCSFLGHVKQA